MSGVAFPGDIHIYAEPIIELVNESLILMALIKMKIWVYRRGVCSFTIPFINAFRICNLFVDPYIPVKEAVINSPMFPGRILYDIFKVLW